MATKSLKGSSYNEMKFSDAGNQRRMEAMQMIMKDEPEMTEVLLSAMQRYGLSAEEVFGGAELTYVGQPNYTIGIASGASGTSQAVGTGSSGSGQTTDQQTSDEIDTKIQLLLNAIPIADPGKIITSEYHNSLRDAIRAIASRIGLSVNPVSEFKILSFAPNFQPLTPEPSSTSGPSGNKWEIFLLNAAIPANVNAAIPVKGGFLVQLPDNSTIFQMIVRGARNDKDKPKPEKFTVKLSRLKLGTDKMQPTVLIDMDLSKVADGYFEEKDTVKLAENELDTDTITAQNKIADRSLVNNKTHLYFVSAEWLAGPNNPNAARSEIRSIQIFCAV